MNHLNGKVTPKKCYSTDTTRFSGKPILFHRMVEMALVGQWVFASKTVTQKQGVPSQWIKMGEIFASNTLMYFSKN